MAADIIAESQTQRTIDTLLRGEADAKSQQVALASLLIAMTKQNGELQEIKSSLWSKKDVEAYVDSRHKSHCDNCPAKRYVDSVMSSHPSKEKKSWIMELLTSETFRYFFLVVLFGYAIIQMKTSTEEAAAVMDKVTSTLSGGVVK